MDKESAFHVLDFVENIKDKISNIEYKEILEYVSSKYIQVEKRKLYTILYSVMEIINFEVDEDKEEEDKEEDKEEEDKLKKSYKRDIQEECLVRLTPEEHNIISNLIPEKKDIYDIDDLNNMYKILYIQNSIGNFNFRKKIITAEDNFNIKIHCPIILSIYEPKDIDSDTYSFEIDYLYSKKLEFTDKEFTRENIHDIEEYKNYWLTVYITSQLSIDEYKYAIENIFNDSLKILYENRKDLYFKRYLFEDKKHEIFTDDVFLTMSFEEDTDFAFVDYKDEKYYIKIVSYTQQINIL
jgi:hypothetical protein